MASSKALAAAITMLAMLAFCEARQPTAFQSSSDPAHATAELADPCRPGDISIQQFEASGVGIPEWEVQIVNQCTNPLCMVSEVVVSCGAFHSPTLVNPRVFRRLDPTAGTCLVNDGGKIPNAQTVTFQYHEIMKEPLSLKSAKVTCW